MEEALLTPEQVARRLQVTPRTIYDWLRKGRLRGIKLGRLWRVRMEDLDALLNETSGEARAPKDASPQKLGVDMRMPRNWVSWDPKAPTPDELEAERARKYEAAVRMLEKWRAEEPTEDDEKEWQIAKRAIEENRTSYRKRFAD